jgi:ferritin-like metal-binding protein YciE
MQMESLRELYIDELKDLWSAEKQIVKALPKMAKAATSPKLKRAFTTHLRQTEGHVRRLERIMKQLDESPRGKKCVGMEGLIKEGSELISERPEKEVLDAGLLGAAQHVEHYEIAGYGCVRTWANELGLEAQAALLQQTLDEEKETDALLSELAISEVNVDADGDEDESSPPHRFGPPPGASSVLSYGFNTTLMHPSFLSRNVLYRSGASASGARCVMMKLGSIVPASIFSSSG